VECVPNFSEGRRREVIDSIIAPLRSQPGAHLLDWRADPDHNRLVATLVGSPGPVQEAVLRAAAAAIAGIDMREHRGAHPRIGAVDVVPFVPLRSIAMAECVEVARGFGERFSRELKVPVYLYEEAAFLPERRSLEKVRKGELETLAKEIGSRDRRPDYGEPRLHPTAGATAVGARAFLLAFNVNLDSTDIDAARSIARAIRASSGGLPGVKAVGVDLAQRGLVQVSINVTDPVASPLAVVFEAVREQAARRGIAVAESELYGMAPAEALLAAAAHYLKLAGFDASQVLELRLLDLPGKP
jgi:glutamate formiminotransferase